MTTTAKPGAEPAPTSRLRPRVTRQRSGSIAPYHRGVASRLAATGTTGWPRSTAVKGGPSPAWPGRWCWLRRSSPLGGPNPHRTDAGGGRGRLSWSSCSISLAEPSQSSTANGTAIPQGDAPMTHEPVPGGDTAWELADGRVACRPRRRTPRCPPGGRRGRPGAGHRRGVRRRPRPPAGAQPRRPIRPTRRSVWPRPAQGSANASPGSGPPPRRCCRRGGLLREGMPYSASRRGRLPEG